MNIMTYRALLILDRFVHERLRKQALVTVLSMGLGTEREESEKYYEPPCQVFSSKHPGMVINL